MPTPEDSFNRFDSNGNGRIDPDEISSSRFLPRLLGDADYSRGLSRDEFVQAMQRARENMERNGFGGRGGSFRGSGGRGGPDSGRRGDGERDGRDSGDRSRSGGDNSSRDGAPGESSGDSSGSRPASGSTTNNRKSRPRITVDLQSEFLPGDSDRDGQLGLYEWRRFAGRSLAEFRQLDRNQDGFVTPAEVAIARPDLNPTPPATTVAPATPQTASSPQPAATPAAGSASGEQPESWPGDEQAAQDAGRFFRLLDTNRDGQIDPEEWEGSSRIRSMFTDGGVDLSEPIDAAEFDRLYVRLSTQRD